jgi:hypothetical protein
MGPRTGLCRGDASSDPCYAFGMPDEKVPPPAADTPRATEAAPPVYTVKLTGDAFKILSDLQRTSNKSFEDILKEALALGKLYFDVSSQGGRLMVEQGGKVQSVKLKTSAA